MKTTPQSKYFDTDTLRLLRHGLTLSHRKGEWELESPEGRVLVLTSPAWREVPQDMRKLVRAYTRDDDLVPIAKMRGGGASELRKFVDGRLVAPPRPVDGSARGVVMAYVRAQIAALARADLAVRQDLPDSVHRMRVAARRLRSVFGTYATVLGGRKLLRELNNSLRWLAGELSPARDAEVQWARLDALADWSAADAARMRIDEYFEAMTEDAKARVTAALGSRRYVQLLDALDVLEVVLSEEPRRRQPKVARCPAGKVLPGLVRDVAAEVGDRVAGIEPGQARDLAVHDVRKSAKRLRYAIEAARGVLPVNVNGALERLRAFQDLLGEFQDAVVAQAHLRALATETSEDSYAVLRETEAEAANRCVEALPVAWQDVRADLSPLWTNPRKAGHSDAST